MNSKDFQYLIKKAISANNVTYLSEVLSRSTDASSLSSDLIFDSINSNSKIIIDLLLSSGIDFISYNSNYDSTPLQYAVKCKNTDAAELLMKYGAMDSEVDDGASVMYYAVLYHDLDFIKKCIDYGGNPSAMYPKKDTTAFHESSLAGLDDVVQLFVIEGFDSDCTDYLDRTPIYYSSNEQTTRILIESGTNLFHIDSNCMTPVDYHSRKGNNSTFALIFERAKSRNSDLNKNHYLWVAGCIGNLSVMSFLGSLGARFQNSSNDPIETMIIKSIRANNRELLSKYFDLGYPVSNSHLVMAKKYNVINCVSLIESLLLNSYVSTLPLAKKKKGRL